MYGVYQRAVQDAAEAREELVNSRRNQRTFDPSEVVFRRMPNKARTPKHLLGDPSNGPYVVVSHLTNSSVALKDPGTGLLLDEGRGIPLDQILAGPRRSRLVFGEESDVRAWSDMAAGAGAGVGPRMATKKSGWLHLAKGAHGAFQVRAAGPEARNLRIGRVLENLSAEGKLRVHAFRGCWKQVWVQHRPMFRHEEGAISL